MRGARLDGKEGGGVPTLTGGLDKTTGKENKEERMLTRDDDRRDGSYVLGPPRERDRGDAGGGGWDG